MKIEKVNDNQIRCTLNRTDLAERELKLSELAYGSDKARELFRDMMQQASFEFGFEADDIPLMIEAIPVSSDCIILMITKVEDPEELDTRFSRFAPSYEDGVDEDSADDYELGSLFSKIQEIRDAMELSSEELDKLEDIADNEDSLDELPFSRSAIQNVKRAETATTQAPTTRLFAFQSLDQAADACKRVHTILTATTALYKNDSENTYVLVINGSVEDMDSLNSACHILSEYGRRLKAQCGIEDFYKEHWRTIVKENAVQVLGRL